ncbi:hypothetical protein C8F04DRAFT_1406028, partial [Mycena alexandri]
MGGCISSPAPPGAEVSERDRALHRQAEKQLKEAKAKMQAQVKVGVLRPLSFSCGMPRLPLEVPTTRGRQAAECEHLDAAGLRTVRLPCAAAVEGADGEWRVPARGSASHALRRTRALLGGIGIGIAIAALMRRPPWRRLWTSDGRVSGVWIVCVRRCGRWAFLLVFLVRQSRGGMRAGAGKTCIVCPLRVPMRSTGNVSGPRGVRNTMHAPPRLVPDGGAASLATHAAQTSSPSA